MKLEIKTTIGVDIPVEVNTSQPMTVGELFNLIKEKTKAKRLARGNYSESKNALM